MHWKRALLTQRHRFLWLDHPRLHPIAIIVLRCAWSLLLIGCGWILVLGSPLQWSVYHAVCPNTMCEPLAQLNAESLHFLAGLGVPLDLYAAVIVGTDWLYVLCWWTLGLLLIWHRPRDIVALLVAFASVSTTASFYAQRLSPVLPSSVLPVFTFLGDMLFIWFAAVFPNGSFVPRWSRLATLILILSFAVLDLVLTPLSTSVPLEGLIGILLFFYLLSIQVYRYFHVSDRQERRQARWVVLGIAGLAVTIAGAMTLFLLGQVGIWLLALILLSILSNILLPLAIGIAVFRYRLFAIDIILHRTFVYGGLTVALIGGYALIVGTIGTLLETRSNFLVSLIGAGTVAILFQPLREWLQRAANRFFYGERDDPYVVLTQLGERLEATRNPETVLPVIAEAIRETLKLPYAAITLAQNGEVKEKNTSSGTAQGPLTEQPLTYQGRIIGTLLVSPRAGEAEVSPPDRRLLANLAQQAGIALHAVLLTQEVLLSREQLVTAREEERRRLRRDLHDGLGPALATITLWADTARGLLRDDPQEAETLLSEVTSQAQTTMQEVRRLIHALRPPVLDDLGLIAALQAFAPSFSASGLTVTVNAPATLPPLPAAIEVAVYRIVQEALINVVKHAHASTCTIEIICDEQMVVTLRDNGIGISADRIAGVGLHSMRERVAELGGTLRISAGLDKGTCIEAHFPLRRTHGSHSHLDR